VAEISSGGHTRPSALTEWCKRAEKTLDRQSRSYVDGALCFASFIVGDVRQMAAALQSARAELQSARAELQALQSELQAARAELDVARAHIASLRAILHGQG
jgi:multidrug resistance efflux pump